MVVSIVTVSYNSSKTISDTIISVLNQTYPNIEYIIIDGMSTDNTVEVIESFTSMFNGRIKWISEKDNGLYDAMNKGIMMATGDIIGTLNSDDFFSSPSSIQDIVCAFEKEQIQVVFGDVRFVDSNNLDKTKRYYSSSFFNPKLFRFGFMPAHPTFYTYLKNFKDFGFYNEKYEIAADYELLLRFLQLNKLPYRYIPKELVRMRFGGKSTKSIKSNLILNKEILRACKENHFYTNIIFIISKYVIKIFEYIKFNR